MTNATLVEAPQSHADAKKNVGLVLSFHKSSLVDTSQALIRDGYRCVVTGKYDVRSVMKIRELEDTVLSDPSARSEGTRCVHIFAESNNSSIEPGSAKVCPSVTFLLYSKQRLSILCCHNVGGHASLWPRKSSCRIERLQRSPFGKRDDFSSWTSLVF